MYLTKAAIASTMRQIAGLAPGSTLVMTFAVPLELVEPEELPLRHATEKGARASGTPWISFFTGLEIVALARESGFRKARHVPSASLAQRYFAGRTDGLRPSSSEEILVAST
jgi:O-methyltransferase involved in polyketide biosynthesis